MLRKYLIEIIIILVGILISLILVLQYNSFISSVFSQTTETNVQIDPITGEDLIRGAPNPTLFYIVEYGDLQCPFCQKFHPVIKRFLSSSYGTQGKVSWVFRDGPHIDEVSDKKTLTIGCVKKYEGNTAAWEFIDESLLTVRDPEYPKDRYRELFSEKNWDTEKIETCVDKRETVDILQKAKKDVRDFSIDVTPYLVFLSPLGEVIYDYQGVLTYPELQTLSELAEEGINEQ